MTKEVISGVSQLPARRPADAAEGTTGWLDGSTGGGGLFGRLNGLVDGHLVIFPERSKKNNSGNWFYFLVITEKFTGHLSQACSASRKGEA
jgi:hypothetical protein